MIYLGLVALSKSDIRVPLGLCALSAPESATPALSYTVTPQSATLQLPCAAIVFRDGRRPAEYHAQKNPLVCGL